MGWVVMARLVSDSSDVELLRQLQFGRLELVEVDVSRLESFMQFGELGEDRSLVAGWWQRLGRLSCVTLGALGRLGGRSLAAGLFALLLLEPCLTHSRSDGADVARFFALAPRTDFELDLLALGERLNALTLDIRHMDEHVVATVASDESEPAVPIEVLHFALHNYQLALFRSDLSAGRR